MNDKLSFFTPLSPQPGLTETVAAHMAAEISEGRLASGNRLPSLRDLAAQFGVSQTVIREAIARLRADGLVVARHGSGLYVDGDARRRPLRIDPQSMTTIKSVANIMEVRLSLEVEAAGLAAERGTDGDARRIGAALKSFDRALSARESAVEEDRVFHAAIATAAHNPTFLTFLEFMGRYIIPRQQIRVGWGALEEQSAYLLKIKREHLLVYEAIIARDVPKARTAMRRHLWNGLNRLRKLEEESKDINPSLGMPDSSEQWTTQSR